MAMKVIGAGVGRTGTYSLKLAINQLGLGPCHHMEAVLHDMPTQVPLWSAALNGEPDWSAIYAGFESAEGTRSIWKDRKDWADSFSATIYKLLAGRDEGPPEMKAWLDMANDVIDKTGFPPGLDVDDLAKAFVAHNEAVKATVPANQLLVYEVKQGWQPLCEFLGVPAPAGDFPRTNDRAEFWDRVTGKI